MNSLLYSMASLLIGGVVVYYAQSRIRVREQKDTAAIHGEASAATTPLEAMRQQLTIKDTQIATIQQQQYDFVQAQMARNDASTRALLDLASQVRAQTETLKEHGINLQAHREESAARGGRVYEKIGDVNERLATIEARINGRSS